MDSSGYGGLDWFRLSNGTNCLEEANLSWERLSAGGNCLEQAPLPSSRVALRSSERPHEVIVVPIPAWREAQRRIASRWEAHHDAG